MKRMPRLPSPRLNRWRAWQARLLWRWQLRSHAVAKRALDLIVVVPLLLLLAPLLAMLALAIRIQDGGPALFWQRRVGREGREFALPKFRSMHVDAEARRAELLSANQHGADGVSFKLRSDPRVTRLGRVMRRFSLDELPQLWCVLRGDMSLVGPRPPLVSEVQRYSIQDRERLLANPGLTCIWQVSGRSELPFEQQVQLDMEYLRRPGLVADLKLLFRTIPAVIKGRGAY